MYNETSIIKVPHTETSYSKKSKKQLYEFSEYYSRNMVGSHETVAVPKLERLSTGGIETIHESSMTILEDIGISVDHDEAQRFLAEAGCTIDDDIVRFPPDLVIDSIDQAPASFTLHGRGDGTSIPVGGDDRVIAPAASPPNVVKFDEPRRPSTIDDYEELLKLAHSEDVINCTGGTICEPNDVDQEVKHLETVKRHLLFSDKPLMGSAYGGDRAAACIDMVGVANDDPQLSRPYIITVANSVSPRTWDTKMCGGLIEYARNDQPVIISPAVMAAASGPATLAGAMALANAEILAGVTLAQQVSAGTPVLYGLPSSNVDVRYGSFSIGSPEGALFVSFAGQMARFYDIPSRAGGGLTDTKTMDDQGGAEAMFQLMTTFWSGIDFVLHAAGILDSYSTASPEKFILDCDRIRYLQRFERGFDISDESIALDLIEEVDPGGHFLNKRHTMEHCKTEFHIPDIYDRKSFDDWDQHGNKSAFERAHERMQQQLEKYERPPIDEDIEADLTRYVEEKRADILG